MRRIGTGLLVLGLSLGWLGLQADRYYWSDLRRAGMRSPSVLAPGQVPVLDIIKAQGDTCRAVGLLLTGVGCGLCLAWRRIGPLRAVADILLAAGGLVAGLAKPIGDWLVGLKLDKEGVGLGMRLRGDGSNLDFSEFENLYAAPEWWGWLAVGLGAAGLAVLLAASRYVRNGSSGSRAEPPVAPGGGVPG
jgi:hypothetical protein